MDLRPFKVVAHYLLFEGMAYIVHRDEVTMMSALICMVIYWTKPMVSHAISYWVFMTSLNSYATWALNLERILS